jgi:hypothetical protein
LPSIIKVDQIQSDTGAVNVSSNLQFSSGFTMLSPTLSSPTLTTPTTSGILTLGAGIQFPATQVSSADANTLDDYEEGTWTPSISFGSGSATVSSVAGTYTKIGRLVTVTVNIELAGASSAANLQINNLPFSQLNSHCSSGIVRENANNGYFYGFSFGSGTLVYMHKYDNSNTLANGTTRYTGTYTYITS